MRKLLLYTAIALTLTVLFSCNAAKQTAKQDERISALKKQFKAEEDSAVDKAISDYLLTNPYQCPDINLDSVCPATQLVVVDTSDYDFKVDTVKRLKLKPQTILKYLPPDQRLANMLKDSLAKYKQLYASSCAEIKGIKDTIPKPVECPKSKYVLWFWLLVAFEVVRIGFKYYFKIAWL